MSMVNRGLENGFLFDDTKPLTEPLVTRKPILMPHGVTKTVIVMTGYGLLPDGTEPKSWKM